MKEATGELNMTVVTVVAIAAVGAFFYAFVWPNIKAGLMKNTCNNVCPMDSKNSNKKTTVKKNGDNYVCNCADGTTIELDANGQFTGDSEKN